MRLMVDADRGMVFQQGALFEWLTVAEKCKFWIKDEKVNPKSYTKS